MTSLHFSPFMSLPKWSSKRKESKGGGLMSANPPTQSLSSPTQDQSRYFQPESDNDDEEFESIASSEASTSRNPITRLTRELSADSSMIDDPEVDFSSGKKRKVKDAPKSKVPAKKKKTTKESDFVSSIPWPDHFKELEKTFKVRTRSSRSNLFLFH